MQKESLIKLKFVKEGQIKVAINLCVNILSKMLWKFIKIKFFSSYSLIYDLATKGFRATGTIKNDRIMKCPLVDAKKNEEK